MKKRVRQALVIGCGIVLLGVAGGEHALRRAADRRYGEAVTDKQRLEQRVATILSTHERLTGDLQHERTRAQELTEALSATRAQLEEAVGRLTEEHKTVSELQVRLTAMQRQMDQLQGELAMALETPPQAARASSAAPVQLERVVVTDPSGAGQRGRVVSVNPDWNFVVVDLGWDAVRIGDTISLFRNEQLLGKARVERVQEAVCAATLLPGVSASQIEVNDVATVL